MRFDKLEESLFWHLLPPPEQVDGGIGLIGEAFMVAAYYSIEKESENMGKSTGYQFMVAATEKGVAYPGLFMPISFLLRHACELFLKSLIRILYRYVNDDQHGVLPQDISDASTVGHDLQAAWLCVERLLEAAQTKGGFSCDLDLPATRQSISEELAEIARIDRGGVTFRYPNSGPANTWEGRTVWKRVSPPKLKERERVRGFILSFQHNRRIYESDAESIKKMSKAVRVAADDISDLYCVIRSRCGEGHFFPPTPMEEV